MTARVAVAIDGPAGAGKSTVSRAVAQRLGYVLLDTGALYRLVAFAAHAQHIDWSDEAALGALARDMAFREAFGFRDDGEAEQRVLLDGNDVTALIRTPHLSEGASQVSAHPAVREALLGVQRSAGMRGGVVLEGRDIGTVVLPSAEAKFFLTASVDVRAERRYRELCERGVETSLDDVRKDVVARDHRDTTRAAAPLRQAADAVLLDSSDMNLASVIDRIVEGVRAVIARRTTT